MREIGTARQMNARALRTLSGNMLLSLNTSPLSSRSVLFREDSYRVPRSSKAVNALIFFLCEKRKASVRPLVKMRFEKMGALVWTLLDFRHWRLNIKDFVLGPVLGPQHYSLGEEA
jgi:hypothetical protein